MKLTASERTRLWRIANPEKLAEQRKREAEREKNLEVKAKRRAYRLAHRRKPEVKERIAKRKTLWMQKPENKAYYLQYYRDKNDQYPWLMLIAKAKFRCKTVGLEYSLSKEWATAMWDGKCSVTGLPFSRGNGRTHILSPSLDRIDSSKGYTPENCRFVCWGINRFKGEDSDADMILLARAMLERLE
jgi:hypothetical protein